MSRKLVALFLGVMLVFVALAIDITYVNATKGEKYERQVLSQTQQSYDSRTIPFQRGSITDRNGTILATSEKVYNVILDCKLANTTVKDEEKNDTHPYVDPTVAALVEYFGLDETDIRDRLTGETTKESQYQVLAREVSMDAEKSVLRPMWTSTRTKRTRSSMRTSRRKKHTVPTSAASGLRNPTTERIR